MSAFSLTSSRTLKIANSEGAKELHRERTAGSAQQAFISNRNALRDPSESPSSSDTSSEIDFASALQIQLFDHDDSLQTNPPTPNPSADQSYLQADLEEMLSTSLTDASLPPTADTQFESAYQEINAEEVLSEAHAFIDTALVDTALVDTALIDTGKAAFIFGAQTESQASDTDSSSPLTELRSEVDPTYPPTSKESPDPKQIESRADHGYRSNRSKGGDATDAHSATRLIDDISTRDRDGIDHQATTGSIDSKATADDSAGHMGGSDASGDSTDENVASNGDSDGRGSEGERRDAENYPLETQEDTTLEDASSISNELAKELGDARSPKTAHSLETNQALGQTGSTEVSLEASTLRQWVDSLSQALFDASPPEPGVDSRHPKAPKQSFSGELQAKVQILRGASVDGTRASNSLIEVQHPTLGVIRLEVSLEASGIILRASTKNRKAASSLRRSEEELRSEISRRGLHLSSLEIEVETEHLESKPHRWSRFIDLEA